MKLLAIDTSTEACSAALLLNGETTECFEIAPRRHAELILAMVDQLLVGAGVALPDLDALVFGRGPGAFTGVRIAAGVIQGLAFSAALPVIPVSTLAALAQGTQCASASLISAIDARMGEIYWGLYQRDTDNLVIPIQPEAVCRPENIQLPEGHRWYGTGSGWQSYQEILQNVLKDTLIGFRGDCFPRAMDMIPLAIRDFQAGKMLSAERALPVYLRDKVTG